MLQNEPAAPKRLVIRVGYNDCDMGWVFSHIPDYGTRGQRDYGTL
jgi:hypothetical protein